MRSLRDLIGKPYALPCDPPKSYDCWELVVEVRKRLGIITPIYVPVDERAAFGPMPEPPVGWVRLAEARKGCVAAMGLTRQHVGVYLGSAGILHASENGVAIHKVVTLKRLYRSMEFWDYAQNRH